MRHVRTFHVERDYPIGERSPPKSSINPATGLIVDKG